MNITLVELDILSDTTCKLSQFTYLNFYTQNTCINETQNEIISASSVTQNGDYCDLTVDVSFMLK